MKRLSSLYEARPNLLTFVGYALLTLMMTYPVVTRLTTHLVGWGNDPFVHYWNNWWVGQALKRGMSPYHTDMLFHPNGASMVFHNFAWLNIVGSLVLKPLTGPVGAYNIVFLANVALGGFAMYHLANYVLGHRAAAFVAGLVHAFWPYRMHHTAHPNLISTQWMVWSLLFLMKTVREGKRRHVLLAALFLTLTAFARLQLLVLTLFPAAIYLLHSFLTRRDLWNWQTIGRLALVGALTGAALAYPFLPLLREQLFGDHPGDLFIDEHARDQSDLAAYILPNPPHPLRSIYAPDILRTQIVFVGYTTLILAIYGAVKGTHTRLWLLIGLFSFLMALGPSLRVYGKVFPRVPLPYRLLGWSFPVRIMRSPHRFNILLAIPVALLAGSGVRVLSRSGCRARWVPLLAAGLVLFEYLRVPLPTISLDYSPFYDRLAAISDRFGVYDLPMGFSGPAKFYMYLQTIHEKPIVQGKMARPERDINEFIDGNPFTEHLRLTKKKIDSELTAVSRHLAYLADANVRYLFLHRDPQLEDNRPSKKRWAAWKDWLITDPIYQDERIAVYRTRPRYGRDFEFAVDLGADVGIIQVGQIPESLSQGNILKLDLRWGSRAAPGHDLEVELALLGEAGTVQQSTKVRPCADWPTSEWPAGAVAIGRYRFQIDPHLEPGSYALVVRLIGTGHSATLGHLNIESLPRTFEPPEQMGHTLGARFGQELRLLGYDVVEEDNALEITLHWQATDRPDAYYKAFVHLFDPETGAIVAQHDAVPRDWTYPTTWWQEGEVVSDEISLSMESVPAGHYRLAVGLYHPDSGERLPVTETTGERQSQGRLLLPEEIDR
jgi:hypothetical protein